MAIRHQRSRRSRSTDLQLDWKTDGSALIVLWMLRLLVPLGGHHRFIKNRSFGDMDESDHAVAVTLGLTSNVVDEDGEAAKKFSARESCKELGALHRHHEKKSRNGNLPGNIRRNMDLLATKIGLSEVDCRILELAICLHHVKVLADTADFLGDLSSAQATHVLSVALDLPKGEVSAALKSTALLASAGLVELDRDNNYRLGSKLDMLSDGFVESMVDSDTDPISMMKDSFFISEAPHLCLDDYPHVPELKALRAYVQAAVKAKRRGVNIFIYGYPGTGKTQLARVLAKALACELYEVGSERAEGDSCSPQGRIKSLRLAQHLFARSDAMLLFDEASDIFDSSLAMSQSLVSGKASTAQAHKAATNRMLEEGAVVTLWLSNSIHGLDPAFVRRFDMVLELPIPPRHQRRKILEQSCRNLLSPEALDRFAAAERLAPAVVTRAASVVGAISGKLGKKAAVNHFELMLNNTLKAQGNRPIAAHDPNALPSVYDPAFINCDGDVKHIAAGLKKSKSGRMCLYGPPGTGKTAAARWLAEYLKMPLLVKRCSDIVSYYVGETERNIAATFAQATVEKSLLLIDEMDSFLQDRRRAQCSWEVTAVNEMLTQMESFDGIFIASTNLMDGLDQAALRRFDLKLKFDFLRPEQAEKLFARYCAEFGLKALPAKSAPALRRLRNATPGDFAAIARRHRFAAINCADALLAALTDECAQKENPSSPIGFV